MRIREQTVSPIKLRRRQRARLTTADQYEQSREWMDFSVAFQILRALFDVCSRKHYGTCIAEARAKDWAHKLWHKLSWFFHLTVATADTYSNHKTMLQITQSTTRTKSRALQTLCILRKNTRHMYAELQTNVEQYREINCFWGDLVSWNITAYAMYRTASWSKYFSKSCSWLRQSCSC